MVQNNQELTGPHQINEHQSEVLITEHRKLDEKVTELSDQPFLTPEQSLELIRLKKEKLRLKDLIASMEQKQKSA